ncbi:hypothetical protein MMC14_004830 [Varicellaria rhodocarpa]|nr:hypothetical protein [Varicellaria rhodocarpa]
MVGTLFDALETWLGLCRLDEAQSGFYYEEACQLEVFDLLGMAHTCCAYKGLEARLPEESREQLREEDEDLKAQLGLIMQAYRKGVKRHVGDLKEFWINWMQKLNEILPELAPEERCRRRCLNFPEYRDYKLCADYSEKETKWHYHRSEIEEKALTKNGYSGLDFLDVNQLHFADYLSPSSYDLENPREIIAPKSSQSPPQSAQGLKAQATNAQRYTVSEPKKSA